MRRQHRRSTRPRYRRITAAGASALVTLVAILGGIGLLPANGASEPAYGVTAQQVAAEQSTAEQPAAKQSTAKQSTAEQPTAEQPAARVSSQPREHSVPRVSDTALPKSSGEGRRVVFDESAQRVWLVSAGDEVLRTYLVSGSVTDNLEAGSYEVYSKSLDAVGIDDSGTMRYMVRFAEGSNAPIGFHDIPVNDGRQVQSVSDLGTPQSHGCIRQRRADAKALWRFAPVGTPVVVLA